jgi:hypothetical protein
MSVPVIVDIVIVEPEMFELVIFIASRSRIEMIGVTRLALVIVGAVANTKEPVPVSSVTAVLKLALEGVARNVATPVARPDTPVEIGSPVALVNVPEVGVPRIGVTRVGLVANTNAPVPVSSVTAVIRFALEGVARNVATPEARPEIPVDTGSPVALVKTPADGVPRLGVTRAALVIGALKRLELLRTQPELKDKLWEITNALQSGLKAEGFELGNTDSPVTPVYLNGTIPEATNLILDLRENYDIFCSMVVYPVVPKGVIMLRLIPTAVHTLEDVTYTINAFKDVKKNLQAGKYNLDKIVTSLS